QITAYDAKRPDQHLDPASPQIIGESPGLWKHNKWDVAVESSGDQVQLAIGAIPAARGVDEQNRPRRRAQSSTESARPVGSVMHSGCRMCASSSSPSTIRGPGREKYAAASTATTSPAPTAASSSRCISASRWAISAS